MPAIVQTRSRQNRIQNMKKFWRHAYPAFRCYRGSRLPPKTGERFGTGAKFYSKDIKWGAQRKEKKKVSGLLSSSKKKGPAKRETRGILKVKKAKGKAKKVRFKKKGVMKRHEQKEQLYDPYQVDRHTPRVAGPYTREQMVGSRGDPQGTQFRLTPGGKLVPVQRSRGKIMIV